MKIDNSFNLISRIREKANALILKELEQIGLVDIAPSHGDILGTLMKHKQLTMTEIANHIHRDRSTVTTLVNKLVQLGYVASKKDPQDNRSNIVFLTPKGEALQPQFHAISERLFATAYQGISEEDRNAFQKVLEKVFDNL